jgi:hypothetical protein
MNNSIIITLAIFIMGNLVATVWWASKITSMVDNLHSIVEKLASVIDDHTKNLYTKSEAMTDLKKIEETIAKMWERIDAAQSMALELKTKCAFVLERKEHERP